jgi:hypothetical protein
MFARTDAGEPIKRETTCECGTPFVQRMLSDRFMTAMEKNGAAGEVLRQIPELYVPVFCPPCERRDIGRWARIAESRSLPDIRPSFGERDHAAD